MKKSKSPSQQSTLPSYSKDSNSYRIIATVRQIFQSGKKVTARQINEVTGSNDARKVISTLRASGWNIEDIRLPDNRKLYWLVESDRQLPLFTEGANDNE